MRKLLLVAAIGVASFANAKGNENANVDKNTEIENKEKTEQKALIRECGVVITYWVGGQVVGQQTVTSDQPDLESCQKWQNGVKFALQIAGFWTI